MLQWAKLFSSLLHCSKSLCLLLVAYRPLACGRGTLVRVERSPFDGVPTAAVKTRSVIFDVGAARNAFVGLCYLLWSSNPRVSDSQAALTLTLSVGRARWLKPLR